MFDNGRLIGLGIAHLLWFAALIALGRAWLARRPELKPWVGGVVATTLIGALFLPGGDSTWIRPEWVSVLKEGSTYNLVKVMDLQGVHADMVFADFWLELFPNVKDLRHVVSVNLWFSAINLALVALLSRALVGGPAGVALFAGWALSPIVYNASLSVGAGPSSTFYLLIGAMAWGLLQRDDLSWRERQIGWLSMIGAGLGATLVRMELGAVLVAAVGMMALRTRQSSSLGRRVSAGWSTAFATAPFLGFVGVGVWQAAALYIDPFHAVVMKWPWFEPQTVLRGLDPFSGALVVMPEWFSMGMTFGVALLAVVGVIRGVRHPARSAGVVAALLFLTAAYVSSAHGNTRTGGVWPQYAPYEMYRYLANVAAVVWLLAVFGWLWLRQIGGRRLGLAFAALVVLPAYPWLAEHGTFSRLMSVSPDWSDNLHFPRVGLLDRDLQKEVRWMLQVRDAYPDCSLVARTHKEFRRDDNAETTWTVLSPMAQRQPQKMFDGPMQSAPAAVVLAETGTDCALALYTLDCNMVDVDCDPLFEGLTELDVIRFEHLPYLHPEHNQRYGATTRLGVYGLPDRLPQERRQ